MFGCFLELLLSSALIRAGLNRINSKALVEAFFKANQSLGSNRTVLVPEGYDFVIFEVPVSMAYARDWLGVSLIRLPSSRYTP